MIYLVGFELEDFGSLSLADRKALIWQGTEWLVRWNLAWLARHPLAPRLYSSGVVFRREPDGAGSVTWNLWTNIPKVLARGYSHCVGLTAWRIAELRFRDHVTARTCVQVFEEDRPVVGHQLEFHVSLIWGDDDTHEDPARRLGMP